MLRCTNQLLMSSWCCAGCGLTALLAGLLGGCQAQGLFGLQAHHLRGRFGAMWWVNL